MKGFEIYYSAKNFSVENVDNAVKVEFKSTDALLRYRAMQMKLRQVQNIRVSHRDLVHDFMYRVDPETPEACDPGTKMKKKTSNFSSPGPDMVHSLNTHYKLMAYDSNVYENKYPQNV